VGESTGSERSRLFNRGVAYSERRHHPAIAEYSAGDPAHLELDRVHNRSEAYLTSDHARPSRTAARSHPAEPDYAKAPIVNGRRFIGQGDYDSAVADATEA